MINDDVTRTGIDINPHKYHIYHILMGMTEDDENREWKMILNASNS
jgi:hypothetical protein